MTVQPYKQFSLSSVPQGGQRVRGAIIECGHCGVVANAAVNTFKDRGREEDFITSKFRSMGWKVGSSVSQHRCPGCFAKIRQAAKAKKESGDSNVVQLLTPAADATREITREDRRIIFQKLDEIYDRDGYGGNWTDELVARDLGVPRAWVKTVRDENFGPEGSNEQIKATFAEATVLLKEIKAEGLKVEPLVAALRALVDKADKIERTMTQIQKDLR
jgi:hypothetical protein